MLILANAVFAGAEIAVIATRKTRVGELADMGRRSARAILALKDDPERFLATVQVGITVVSATAAAIGGESIATTLAPLLEPVAGEHADAAALAIVVASVSYVSIVVGELVPKSLALRAAEHYALFIARPLLALSWLAKPLVWFLSGSANVVLRPFGDRTTFSETRHSAEELQELVEEAMKAGTVHPEAGVIAARALELPELTVADVMVPRNDVVAIPHHAAAEEIQQVLVRHAHSRMPVYEDRVDNVVGYVSVKDLIAAAWERDVSLDRIMRAPYFVPESKLAVDLLKEMRTRRMPFAIVVDEQGGTAGIVTMEDLLEELVGEIFSEHVQLVPELVVREPDGTALVSGMATIRDVNRALDIELPDEGPWTTIAGLCLALAGRIPAPGEVVRTLGSFQLEIVDASPRRVRTVRIRPPSERRAELPEPASGETPK